MVYYHWRGKRIVITYQINIKRIIQTVNFLLKLNKYRLNYTKLIKLLYFADRLALKRWDETITRDSFVTMRNGPVLSRIYDLIKGNGWPDADQVLWDSYFMKDNYDLISHVKDDLSADELSDREIEVLKKINKKYKRYNYGKMIDLSHELPECKNKNPGNSSIPLYVNEILKQLGRTNKEIQEIEEDNKAYLEEEKLLKNCV